MNTLCTRSTPMAPEADRVDVRVTWDPRGGWDVSALQGGRVVASRHCDDWHRVERVRQSLPETIRSAASRATAAAALLVVLGAMAVVK